STRIADHPSPLRRNRFPCECAGGRGGGPDERPWRGRGFESVGGHRERASFGTGGPEIWAIGRVPCWGWTAGETRKSALCEPASGPEERRRAGAGGSGGRDGAGTR